MSDLFILDVMVGYILPIQDEMWLFPTVNLKLLNFPSLTISCISPEKQQSLKEKFLTYPPSVIVNKICIKDSQSRIVFKKGKSCSFKLSREETQKLYFPLTVTLKDMWYLPAKNLGKTRIEILVPHLEHKSSIVPVSKLKQIYELCNSSGAKVAMIQLSYKLRRIHRCDLLSDSLMKVTANVQQLKVADTPKQVKTTYKVTTDDPVSKSTELRTICPPPLFYTSTSDNLSDRTNELTEPYVVAEPKSSQNLVEVVWPNGYVHSESRTEHWGEDQYHDVLLPSCRQPSIGPTVLEGNTCAIGKGHDFSVLRTLMKELSAMEQFFGSKSVKAPTQECCDAYVQTEEINDSEDEQPAPSETVAKKSGKLKKLRKKFMRECCTKSPKSDVPRTSPVKHGYSPGRHYKLYSPRNRTVSSVLNESKVKKVKSSLKQKLPPQTRVDPPSQYQDDDLEHQTEPTSQISEQFFINTSMEHTGVRSKLNLDVHMPNIPSATSVGLQHEEFSIPKGDTHVLSSLSVKSPTPVTPQNYNAATTLLKVKSGVPSVTSMASTMPSASASEPDHFIMATAAELQSYSNLSLSTNSVISEDPLNQSCISNLMFSTKHLEAALFRSQSAKDQPSSAVPLDTTENTNHATSNTTSHSPTISVGSASCSVQYKDDFEDDSDPSSNESPLLTSSTSS